MIKGGGRPTSVPAGFTYLGQFIDHDLTFDRTEVTLGERGLAGRPAPGALAEPRPRLVVRRRTAGPGVREVLRRRAAPQDGPHQPGRPGPGPSEGFDLPRGSARQRAGQAAGGHPRPAQRREPRGRPDPPRDDPLPQPGRRQAARLGAGRRARFAARATPGDQALPVDDPHRLPAAGRCASRSWTTSSPNGRKAFEVGAAPTDVPTMPIEFSVAAFRLGHSMIRATYSWNRRFSGQDGSLGLLLDLLRDRRRPRRGHPAAEQLDRRLPPALPLLRHRPHRPRPARRGTPTSPCAWTPGSSTRCATCRPARSVARPCRSTTRAPTSPSATSCAAAWSSWPVVSRWPSSCAARGVAVTTLTRVADPPGQERRHARGPHLGGEGRARRAHAAVVLRAARGRAQRRQARRRRRPDRRGDLPPRHGGQPHLDRARARLAADARARTRRLSGWSTCCSSPSRGRSRCSTLSAAERGDTLCP